MERKKIAVFISALYEDMVRETVEGLLSAGRGDNLKLLFFTSFADNHTSQNYDRYKDYDIGEFVVYLLPDLSEYDALVSFDTYMTGSFIEPINKLKNEAPCPVVTLGTVREGTCNIVNDQDLSFSEVIEHLIVKHGCKDFVHVAGPVERSFCLERIQIFRDTLTRHDPFHAGRIGSFTVRSAPNAEMKLWSRLWPGMRSTAGRTCRTRLSASMTILPSASFRRWKNEAFMCRRMYW